MIRRRRTLLVALLCGILALTVLSGCTGKNAVDQSAGGEFRFVTATKRGELIAAADRKSAGKVTGTLMDGKRYELSAAKGKVVLVNFWAAWCGPCKVETPQLDLLYREVKDTGIDFLGVDTKELHKDQALAFIKDNDISYPNLFDEPGKAALQLGRIPTAGLPFTVVIDKQQRVAAVYLGPVTPADLRPVLTSLVAEQ